MTEQELYYLRSILRQLQQIRSSIDYAPSLGTETLADNIDWLEEFIEKNDRANQREKDARA